MATSLSKEDYLKRYLSGGNDEAKKKKKKKKLQGAVKGARNMMIHDDDIDVKTLIPNYKDAAAVDQLNVDEAPQIADFVDERPVEEVQLEQFRKSKKWKLMDKDKDDNKKTDSGRHDSDSDQSPPRKGRTKDMEMKNKSMSKSNKARHDSDSDMSPPRRTRHDSDSDMSPPRKIRHDSNSDMSPPRRTRHDSDSDMSTPRRTSNQSSNSNSARNKSKQRKHGSDSDLSPPRKSAKRGSDSDLSPPRRGQSSQGSRGGRDAKSRKRRDSDGDLSPPRRKRRDSDGDLSPPRRDKQGKSRLDQMSSGAKAGLQDARTMRKENESSRRRNANMFTHMTDEMSGKNAGTVFRDRSSGRTRDLKMEKIKQREEDQKKAEEDEKFMEWGKGLAQKKQKESNIQDHLHEMDKPMARYRDDKDLDAMLKEKDRDGDPMLAFMKKKQVKQNEKLGIKEKPKYKGPKPPPNRFNIQPGYRWDGVDRSNGFEKKSFIRNADKKAMSEVAYKWSVEDM